MKKGYDLSPIIIVRLRDRLRTHNKFEDSKTLQAIVDYVRYFHPHKIPLNNINNT